jgi:hypothetical protein
MPNLECLDERTKQILSRIDDMDLRITRRFDTFEDGARERMVALEKEVSAIKISDARAEGQKTVTLWVGGLVLAVIGAIGNMLLVWLLGPKGPLGS